MWWWRFRRLRGALIRTIQRDCGALRLVDLFSPFRVSKSGGRMAREGLAPLPVLAACLGVFRFGEGSYAECADCCQSEKCTRANLFLFAWDFKGLRARKPGAGRVEWS